MCSTYGKSLILKLIKFIQMKLICTTFWISRITRLMNLNGTHVNLPLVRETLGSCLKNIKWMLMKEVSKLTRWYWKQQNLAGH